MEGCFAVLFLQTPPRKTTHCEMILLLRSLKSTRQQTCRDCDLWVLTPTLLQFRCCRSCETSYNENKVNSDNIHTCILCWSCTTVINYTHFCEGVHRNPVKSRCRSFSNFLHNLSTNLEQKRKAAERSIAALLRDCKGTFCACGDVTSARSSGVVLLLRSRPLFAFSSTSAAGKIKRGLPQKSQRHDIKICSRLLILNMM